MPLSEYDRYYGGKGKNGASKAWRKMVETYGEEKAKRVFYATANRNKKKGSGLTKATRRRRGKRRRPARS